MTYQILINKKPMKNAITGKIMMFDTQAQAEEKVISHRLTFSQPTFSNTQRRYEVKEAA